MGLCKVEYLAQKERIQQRLQAGYPVSFIHRELSGEGVLTMSSRSLYRLVNADKAGTWSSLAVHVSAPAQKLTKPTGQMKPVDIGEREPLPEKFIYDPAANDDDLW